MIARFCPGRWVIAGAMVLMCGAAPAVAAPIDGNVDSLTGGAAIGWSCVPRSDQPDIVALYAGIHRIGVVPDTVDRPDTSSVCGPGITLNGFQIELSPVVAQQFYGQTNLSLYALHPGAPATLLRPSRPHLTDPYLLASGLIASVARDGTLSGLISNVPGGTEHAAVAIVAGGPAGAGGSAVGDATLTPSVEAPKAFSFSSAALGSALASAPPGYALPIYAYFSHDGGPAVQLGSPAMLGATYLPVNARVAQGGAAPGVTNTIFTKWVPAGMSFRGLTGSITLQGNAAAFSEARVTIGAEEGTQLACRKRNGTPFARLERLSRLAEFTLRANDINADTVPVNIALPYAMTLPGEAGTCLVLAISAGYVFPDAPAEYTTTLAAVAAVLSPGIAEAPPSFAAGLGGEFHFASASEPSLFTVVALKMAGTVQLDAIAGSVSAAGIFGAPAKSGWQPNPIGSWTAATSFYAYPAADCEALGLKFEDAKGEYSAGSRRTPANYVVPPGAVPLLSAPLFGNGSLVSQQTFFQTFPDEAKVGASRIVFSAGDCLVALHNVVAPGDSLYGNLNFEDRATAYFHRSPE